MASANRRVHTGRGREELHAAARSVGLTASGVSRVIARLERRLGVRLLHRTTRSLSLTDDGAAYYERCKRSLPSEDARPRWPPARARARPPP